MMPALVLGGLVLLAIVGRSRPDIGISLAASSGGSSDGSGVDDATRLIDRDLSRVNVTAWDRTSSIVGSAGTVTTIADQIGLGILSLFGLSGYAKLSHVPEGYYQTPELTLDEAFRRAERARLAAEILAQNESGIDEYGDPIHGF